MEELSIYVTFLRIFGWCILICLLLQTAPVWIMLENLAHFDGFAEKAQTDTFVRAYFGSISIFSGYQLFVAVLVLRSARQLRTQQNL